jgi:hypothetical protein
MKPHRSSQNLASSPFKYFPLQGQNSAILKNFADSAVNDIIAFELISS